jgi:hypothetical protein
MNTFICTDCTSAISITAKSCPQCGSLKPFHGVVLSSEQTDSLDKKTRDSFVNGGGKLTVVIRLWQKVTAVFICFSFFLFFVYPNL